MSDTPSPEAIAEALREATPGPWEVRNNGRRATVNAACDQHAMCERTGAIIAKVGEVGDDPLPDAHLIANAPTWLAQLLAALEAAEAKRKEWADLYCLAVEEGQKALDGLHKAERDAVTTQTHLSVAEAALEAKDGELARLREALVEIKEWGASFRIQYDGKVAGQMAERALAAAALAPSTPSEDAP